MVIIPISFFLFIEITRIYDKIHTRIFRESVVKPMQDYASDVTENW